MAYVKAVDYKSSGNKKALWHTVAGIGIVLNYAMRGEKTQDGSEVVHHVSGINCNPMFAKNEFLATKDLYKKRDGVMFYHYIQSFAEDDNLTPEEAHQIGLEFAEKAWPGFEVVVATHTDTKCIHNHFVLNSVNAETGYKYRTKRTHLDELRKISDEFCLAHGLSIIEPNEDKKTSGLGNREYQSAKKGQSWKFRLRSTIRSAMEKCGTKEAFINYMKKAGYEVRWNDQYKNIKYTCTKEKKFKNGKYPEVNDDKLSDEKYLKENMEYEFELRKTDDGRARRAQSNGTTGNTSGESGSGTTRRGTTGDARYTSGNAEARSANGNRNAETDERNRTAEFHTGAFGERGTAEAEFNSGSSKSTRRDGTGWEREREKYRANREAYRNGAGRNKKSTGKSMAGSVRNDRKLGGARYDSLGNLLPTAPLIEDDNKTAEEIEAEENARADQDNVLGAIGFVAGKVIGKIENAKAEAAKANEVPEEPKTDNTSDDDEDEGHGFNLHM
jgi:hypothetical protein